MSATVTSSAPDGSRQRNSRNSCLSIARPCQMLAQHQFGFAEAPGESLPRAAPWLNG
jgi:hypothetical protein